MPMLFALSRGFIVLSLLIDRLVKHPRWNIGLCVRVAKCSKCLEGRGMAQLLELVTEIRPKLYIIRICIVVDHK